MLEVEPQHCDRVVTVSQRYLIDIINELAEIFYVAPAELVSEKLGLEHPLTKLCQLCDVD
jgi:hypothetical protein